MSTCKLTLQNSLLDLNKRKSKTVETLTNSGIQTIEDLIWILPRKIVRLPDVTPFKNATIGHFFRGQGKILSLQAKPNFKGRGRGKAMLYNLTLSVQDNHSSGVISIKWFNAYGSIQNKLKALQDIEFLGVVSEFNGQKQIVNPEYDSIEKFKGDTGLRVQYPTVSGINSNLIKKLIDKIPFELWESINENLPASILSDNDFLTRSEAFKYLHGRVDPSNWDNKQYNKAKERLIYEEFFTDQLKIELRKSKRKQKPGAIINVSSETEKKALSLYPYQLTDDQSTTLKDIVEDFKSQTPMMRLVQGDVGCGKTTVATLSCFYAIKDGYQTAFMCPTESLATQHYRELVEIMPEDISIALLIGSTKAKEKREVLKKLEDGEIDLIIGTHSLFQDSVIFNNLGFCVIDEQHKFGVEQRLRLVRKGKGAHCLVMSATPIPRSLSLTQYGDLEISIIKTMPSGRKGSKTRVVTQATYQKYLSFVKTRLEMGEQVYVVVPAINENPELDIKDLENTFEQYKEYFPEVSVQALHGQMKSEEKAQVFKDFGEGKIQVLVATSVIEVGINVLNATVIAILSPERFGLSSLHQIRGRVGRGSKPGFCFLVTDRPLSPESMHRLQVIEKSSDGFVIAEEDLKIRGEGDLFGAEQSGVVTQKKIANIIQHQDILYRVLNDYKKLKSSDSQIVSEYMQKYSDAEIIYTTI